VLQVLAAIFGISLLVIVHEAGHYWIAGKFGIRVTHFSIGFGPVLAKYQPKGSGTTFQLCAIPFLGSVTIAGMNPAEPIAPNDPTLYPNKSVLARTLTILAGPVANYLTASVLVFALALTGWREAPPAQPNQPANVAASATASKAPSQSHYVRKSVIEAARLAVVVPYTLTVLNLAGIAELVAHRSTEGLMGPVGMGKLVAQRAEQGLYDYAGILILISVALGCFNLLPLPFLDGGRLTFLAYELVTHRKPSAKFEALVHATGMLALLTLVALVTWRDLIG